MSTKIDYTQYDGCLEGEWNYIASAQMVVVDGGQITVADIRGWGPLSKRHGIEKATEIMDANGRLVADAKVILRRCQELEDALRFCLNVVEKGIEVRMEDRWPALRDALPEAKSRARSVLGMKEPTE